MTGAQRAETFRRGIVAGTAGGLAEVAWVMVYAGLSGGDAGAVARGVTTATGVSALLPAGPAALGVAVHMTLAVALGVALVSAFEALRQMRPALTNPYPFMLVALAGVWAINFFVVLPIVSPGFIGILPYAVSLASKLLFGAAAAAAATLARGRMAPRADLHATPVHVMSRSDRRRR